MTQPDKAEIELAISRQRGQRDSKDGQPFYCTTCGAGWNEYMACDSMECKIEATVAAELRHLPSIKIPAIIGYSVGDYSDIMSEKP